MRAEIIELHHPAKADVHPRQQHHRTQDRRCAMRPHWSRPMPRPRSWLVPAAQADGIRVHGVRLRGLVAHQEAFGADGRDLDHSA